MENIPLDKTESEFVVVGSGSEKKLDPLPRSSSSSSVDAGIVFKSVAPTFKNESGSKSEVDVAPDSDAASPNAPSEDDKSPTPPTPPPNRPSASSTPSDGGTRSERNKEDNRSPEAEE